MVFWQKELAGIEIPEVMKARSRMNSRTMPACALQSGEKSGFKFQMSDKQRRNRDARQHRDRRRDDARRRTRPREQTAGETGKHRPPQQAREIAKDRRARRADEGKPQPVSRAKRFEDAELTWTRIGGDGGLEHAWPGRLERQVMVRIS